MFIHLINFALFNIHHHHTKQIVKIFNKKLINLTKDNISAKIIRTSRDSFVLILPHQSHKEIIQLASTLNFYSHIETYNKNSIPLKLKIASIEYPLYSNDPDTLLEKLLWMLACSTLKHYYYDYNLEYHYKDKVESDFRKLYVLKQALVNETLRFDYQPVVKSTNNSIQYFEALLRIPDENGKYVSVGRMIPLAERTGLINLIDKMVLKMAVRELKKSDITLSINISNIGMTDIELINLFQTLLKDRDIAKRLIVEVTETSNTNNIMIFHQFIDIIHNIGCKIAIDDFGSGYTSFKQLLMLPIDIIKIDGSYIKLIENNSHIITIVRFLIKIAESYNKKTVAEFVDNSKIAELLTDMKIDYMQGNYFAPAVYYDFNKEKNSEK